MARGEVAEGDRGLQVDSCSINVGNASPSTNIHETNEME